MSFLFVPFYINFMGAESFGLVGLYATIQGMFSLLDLGLRTTLNREIAGMSTDLQNAQKMRNLVRTLGIIYWGIGIFIGLIIYFLSPIIADKWLNPEKLSADAVQQTIKIMAAVIILQWPYVFYSGGLIGLQRQVLLNVLNIIFSTLRGAGVLLILWKVSATVQSYFYWQIFISGLQTIAVAYFLWKYLPSAKKAAVFQFDLLKNLWRFAAGISGITFFGLILSQIDKIILSKLLSLENFGYYTFASAIAMSLSRLFSPIFSAVYPRFTQLVILGEDKRLRQLYHSSCQLMSLVVLPISGVLIMFSKEILLFWTQNSVVSENVYLIVSILLIGYSLNGLMNVPYALQLAYSWTRLAFYINMGSVVVIVPLIYFLAINYGSIGAAAGWGILNFGYVIIGIQLMHRRLLKNEKLKWYFTDVGLPLVVSVSVVGFWRILIGTMDQSIYLLMMLVVITLSAYAAVLFVTPEIRKIVLKKYLLLDR